MSNKILCLSGAYKYYAVRYNYLTKPQNTSWAPHFGLLLMRTQSEMKMFINSYSSNSTSISASKLEHHIGIQNDRKRAAEVLSAASGSSQTAIPSTTSNTNQVHSLLKKKLDSMYQYYDRFSHTNDIREAHEHVERLQDELEAAQHRRRDIVKQLNAIRHEIQMCYAELVNCQKGEPRYLEIVRKEYEVRCKC